MPGNFLEALQPLDSASINATTAGAASVRAAIPVADAGGASAETVPVHFVRVAILGGDGYIKMGNSAVVAVVGTSMLMPENSELILNASGCTDIAVIRAAAADVTLNITRLANQ